MRIIAGKFNAGWLPSKQLEPKDAINPEQGIVVLEQLLAALGLAGTIPTETSLLPNYSNPFNPETWSPYPLAKPASVTLNIYAVNGRLVHRLPFFADRALRRVDISAGFPTLMRRWLCKHGVLKYLRKVNRALAELVYGLHLQ